jgi:hypothetical protein
MPSLETAAIPASPQVLEVLIHEARSGRLKTRLERLGKQEVEALSPAERYLASQLLAATERVQIADELAVDRDNDSLLGGGHYVLPWLRRFRDSEL